MVDLGRGWGRARKRIHQRYTRLFGEADRRVGGRLALVQRAWLAALEDEVPLRARSVAYYALFSLFPLLLFLASLSSMFLDSHEAQQTIVSLVERYVPTARGVVWESIGQALRARGAAGIVGLVGLLWAGSGVFGAIYRGVNRAWRGSERLPILIDRLFGLATVLGLGFFLVVMMLSSTVLEVMRSWRVPILGWQPFDDRVTGTAIGWGHAIFQVFVTVLVFAAIYRFVPRPVARWRDVWAGALLAGLLWEVGRRCFTWYMVNAARYSLVYGSVGAIIGFMLWSYLSAVILLSGAEFTAEYSRWRKAGHPIEAYRGG